MARTKSIRLITGARKFFSITLPKYAPILALVLLKGKKMDEKAIPEIVAFKNSCKGITTEKVRDLYTYLMDFGASPKFALTETIRIVTVVENSEHKE